ncbi:MauE/DoxX family redox-associated membrane protein [Conexibacter stalactiti]|uniref:MauE/DoxX family redox-associated membrane protein n=1 Tax=Conexibacter stalactiti TaxID=1940611 RepID=A0ABU4HQQ9_9ACTN|nr:MauE/DoxX family redox-associated membrane protein [Conexibacter stalactiti]MDW5595569.1 MauE/DoxX family redox-associated membrane protein [Conexibacter stalactiti]MEC5036211.1 MauE/DoxX family redox-associated membrane protein [Conexibacter stalactiti]
MTTILTVARALLVAVFAVAGTAKLADRDGAREAARGFGLPPRLAGPLALALPLAELAIAGALVPLASAPWAALAALALLLAFVALIVRALRAGSAPDCHCFGQLHSAPAGRATLVRNGLLAGLAALVAVDGLATGSGGAPSLTGWLGELSGAALGGLAAGAALIALFGAGSWFALELLRQNGRMLERIDRLEELRGGDEVGAGELLEGLLGGNAAPAPLAVVRPAPRAVPDVPLTDLAGEPMPLGDLLRRDLPLLLVFSDPTCGPCRALAPEVAAWQRELDEVLTVAVVGRGDDGAAGDAYGVAGTPSAVLIAPDGLIEGGPVGGAGAIRALMRRAVDVTDSAARPAASA